jgi:hypothetical protein
MRRMQRMRRQSQRAGTPRALATRTLWTEVNRSEPKYRSKDPVSGDAPTAGADHGGDRTACTLCCQLTRARCRNVNRSRAGMFDGFGLVCRHRFTIAMFAVSAIYKARGYVCYVCYAYCACYVCRYVCYEMPCAPCLRGTRVRLLRLVRRLRLLRLLRRSRGAAGAISEARSAPAFLAPPGARRRCWPLATASPYSLFTLQVMVRA